MKSTSIIFLLAVLLLSSCEEKVTHEESWAIYGLPSSVRLNPVTNTIIDKAGLSDNKASSLLHSNWVFDGNKVQLNAARGEYVSFQIVLTNTTDSAITDINVEMTQFKNDKNVINVPSELFLEWCVEVKTPSTGYPKSSLGKGWYPDALVPLDAIQMDSSQVGRWTYPLWLPDFNNRIPNQKSLIIWVDQFIPNGKAEAAPGTYKSEFIVKVKGKSKKIEVELNLWDFEIPNENRLGASLQHEGFLSSMREQDELAIQHMLKRNRMCAMDPTYKPDLVYREGKVTLDWKTFDKRMINYFTGQAFTKEFGYDNGPGYGEPIENFVLPFDVYGKHGTRGWPDIGTADAERNEKNIDQYVNVVKQVRTHLAPVIKTERTDLTIFLNGLDESYFKDAWDRMKYFGELFKQHYPEGHFRIDGAYTKEALDYVGNSIQYLGAHTINYNYPEVVQYREKGIGDWIYGPMIYESKVNSWVGSSTFIDLPLMNDRAISWACWKYGIRSWLSWGIGAGWTHAWYDPETWKDAYKSGSGSDKEFAFKKINGNGMLIYAGGIIPNVEKPCPSIRLKAMRNGVQEYEYMRLLKNLDQNTAVLDSLVNSVVGKPFGEHAIGDLSVWEYDAEKWDRARVEMGNAIHRLSQMKN